MDGSDKGFLSSTTRKPSAIPKLSTTGEADENEQNYEKMASKLQNPKKPPIKHFMSPTISAVSKASAPRKKILSERNESSSFADTHNQNTQNLDSKSSLVKQGTIDSSDRSSSRATAEHIRVSDSGDDDEQNTLGSDSSSKPYDPLTNYLSPRPKFLRYRPNRGREIFLRRQREIGHENVSVIKRSVSFDSQIAIPKEDSSASAHSSSDASSQEGSLKQDDDEINSLIENDEDDDGDEADVFEKETCLSLKAVLKFLLLSVILFLSTLYICSMNSPTPPPMLRAMRDFKDWHHKIHNHTFEVVTMKILDGASWPLGRREATQSSGDDGFKEEVMVEDNSKVLVESTHELGKVVVKMQNGQSEDVCDHQLEEAEEVFKQCQELGTENGEDEWDSELERIEEETPESEDGNDQNLEETREDSDQLKEMEIEETVEKCESSQDLQIQSIYDLLDHHVSESEVHRYSSFKDRQVEGEEKFETSEAISAAGANADCGNTKAATIISEGEVDLVEVTIEHSKTEFTHGTAIGFSIFFVTMALLIYGFYWGRKTSSSSSEKHSLSEERPLSESILADKISSVNPLLSILEEQNIEKVESFETPSSLVRSMEETSEEFYQIRAPRVELLGEFVVGEASSSKSLRSCNRKSKMIETEVSNNSGFQEKAGLQSRVHGASSQVQPSASEFSLLNSPSYGSFTAEKKIVKKEEGKDGEARAIVTTPVRRSNRIRNRAVTSP